MSKLDYAGRHTHLSVRLCRPSLDTECETSPVRCTQRSEGRLHTFDCLRDQAQNAE